MIDGLFMKKEVKKKPISFTSFAIQRNNLALI